MSALHHLLAALPDTETPVGGTLLVADEHFGGNALLQSVHQLQHHNCAILTNRYDVYQAAKQCQLNSYFNDFDFSAVGTQNFTTLLYRVSKEKAVTHHVINQAQQLLPLHGKLILVGDKGDGIKTYAKKAAALFADSTTTLQKLGNEYRIVLTLQNDKNDTKPLDDQNYQQQTLCIDLGHMSHVNDSSTGTKIFSKPGQFGWKKIDQGSALLATCLKDFFHCFSQPPKTILDLGCGYGFLSVMAHQHLPQAQITATDNNAAALLSCEKNFSAIGISGNVVASDCAQHINNKFDVVLCNPPFHRGFDTGNDLTKKFMESITGHLAKAGKALVVTNRFIPIKQHLNQCFDLHTMAETPSFKVEKISLK